MERYLLYMNKRIGGISSAEQQARQTALTAFHVWSSDHLPEVSSLNRIAFTMVIGVSDATLTSMRM